VRIAKRHAVIVLIVLVGTLPTVARLGVARAEGSAGVRWLCSPHLGTDVCNDTPLDNTIVSPNGTRTVVRPNVPPEDQRAVDCFYLYPSTSEATPALTDQAIRLTAQFQTANFAPICRVFAPFYTQWNGFNVPQGLNDALAAFDQYLANDNHGRGVILIGHSQGAILLRQLIKLRIDSNSANRSRFVGAFLMGGNVMVRHGQTIGGDFKNVPLCTQKSQFGCVVAYSTYETNPPPWGFSAFGNANTDILSPLYSTPAAPLVSGWGYQVACTDPGPLSGRTGTFAATVPSAPDYSNLPKFAQLYRTTLNNNAVPTVSTTWVTAYEFTGSCRVANDANTFMFDPVGGRPQFGQPYPIGTHELDMQLGIDRLTTIAQLQTRAWRAAAS